MPGQGCLEQHAKVQYFFQSLPHNCITSTSFLSIRHTKPANLFLISPIASRNTACRYLYYTLLTKNYTCTSLPQSLPDNATHVRKLLLHYTAALKNPCAS